MGTSTDEMKSLREREMPSHRANRDSAFVGGETRVSALTAHVSLPKMR
jgi:hypothetical protein